MRGVLAATLAIAVGVLLVAAVATAEPSTRTHAGKFQLARSPVGGRWGSLVNDPWEGINLPHSLADAATWLTPSVRSQIEAKSIADAKSPSVSVANQGFAYCGNDVVFEYPAYDPTHDSTFTLPITIQATKSDFSDAVASPAPWVVKEQGTDFWFVFLDGIHVTGPLQYWSVPSTDSFPEGGLDHPWVEVANVLWTVDNGQLSGPDVRIVHVYGPNVVSSPVCHL